MSAWRKLLAVFGNKVEGALEETVERAIDIQREGASVLRDYDRKIEEVNKKAILAKTKINLSVEKIRDTKSQIKFYEDVIAKALESGNQEDAVKAGRRVVQLSRTVEILEGGLKVLEPQMEAVKSHIADMKDARQELDVELTNLTLQDQLVETQSILAGVGGIKATPAFTLKDLQGHVAKAKAKLEAQVEFKGEDADDNGALERKYASSATSKSVEDVLKDVALKRGIVSK